MEGETKIATARYGSVTASRLNVVVSTGKGKQKSGYSGQSVDRAAILDATGLQARR